jgi:hypothetical protein
MRSSIHGSQLLTTPQIKMGSSLGTGQASTSYSSLGDTLGNLDPNTNLSPGIAGRPPLPGRQK